MDAKGGNTIRKLKGKQDKRWYYDVQIKRWMQKRGIMCKLNRWMDKDIMMCKWIKGGIMMEIKRADGHYDVQIEGVDVQKGGCIHYKCKLKKSGILMCRSKRGIREGIMMLK